MVELYYQCQSDNGSITDSHALRQWSNKYFQALDSIKDMRAPMRLQSLCAAAGFVEVELKMIPLPMCGWSSGISSPLLREYDGSWHNGFHCVSNLMCCSGLM